MIPNLAQEFEAAWIETDKTIFIAFFPKGKEGPSSAAFKLFQGIFDRFKDHSFFLLRHRVYTTAPENELDRSATKLVAKKISFNETERFQHLNLEHAEIVGEPTQIVFESQFRQHGTTKMENLESDPKSAVQALVKEIARGPVLHDYHRPIAAILKNDQGETLAFGQHSAAINKTLHAEVNLIQSWFLKTGRKVPVASHLHVTHKPCRMCAALILHWSEDATKIRITWDEDVTGQHSRHKLLEKN